MDVKGWPLNKIMQLPDHCFGRRFSHVFSLINVVTLPTIVIHQLSLPDVCVLWEIWAWSNFCFNTIDSTMCNWAWFRLALGDSLPGSEAEFVELEKLPLGGYDAVGMFGANLHLTRLRLPIFAQGRRIVLAVNIPVCNTALFSLGLVFSSLPSEVPDCLLSR